MFTNTNTEGTTTMNTTTTNDHDLFIVGRRGNTLHRAYVGRPYHTGSAMTACGRHIDGVFLPAVSEGDRECAACRRASI